MFPITANEGAASIVRSVIDLARNLGLKVVAEGIEDQGAWDLLRDMGCDIAQGYFLSKPVAGELLHALARRSGSAPPAACCCACLTPGRPAG